MGSVFSFRQTAPAFIRRAALAAGVLVLVAGCGTGGKPLSSSTASAAGWTWPLTVEAGTVTCERGITGPEVAFTPNGSKTAYPLSPDALFARNGGKYEYPGRLSSIRNGQPLKPLMVAAWSSACSSGAQPLDYDVQVLDEKG